MRSPAKIAVVLVVILGLGACMGQDGQPYLALTWSPTYPNYFYTNALPPGTYAYGVYYPVAEGWWQAQYEYATYPRFYIDFLITANKGEFLKDGEDSHFELYMSPTDWVYWQWDSTAGDRPAGDGDKSGSASEVQNADKPIDNSGYERKPLGSFEQVRGRYKMTGTYGVYVPKE